MSNTYNCITEMTNYMLVTLEFQIEGEGGINGEAGKYRPK